MALACSESQIPSVRATKQSTCNTLVDCQSHIGLNTVSEKNTSVSGLTLTLSTKT